MKTDRQRQVETMKKRYGPEVYSKLGKMRGANRQLAKWASWKRWHPERFNAEGRLLKEWEGEFLK